MVDLVELCDLNSPFNLSNTLWSNYIQMKKEEKAETTSEETMQRLMLQNVQMSISTLKDQLPMLQFETLSSSDKKIELKKIDDAKKLAAKISTLKKFPKGTIRVGEWEGYILHPKCECNPSRCSDLGPCHTCEMIFCFHDIYKSEDRICIDCELKEINSGLREDFIDRD